MLCMKLERLGNKKMYKNNQLLIFAVFAAFDFKYSESSY